MYLLREKIIPLQLFTAKVEACDGLMSYQSCIALSVALSVPSTGSMSRVSKSLVTEDE